MIDRDRHSGEQDDEVVVEPLMNGTIIRVPESDSEWLRAANEDVVDVDEKR